MTSFDDELDKLIELHTIDIAYAARRQKTGTLPLERQAFKSAIKQRFLDVIGEDEVGEPNTPEGELYYPTRNGLRQELKSVIGLDK